MKQMRICGWALAAFMLATVTASAATVIRVQMLPNGAFAGRAPIEFSGVESQAAAANANFGSNGTNTWNYLQVAPYSTTTSNPSFSNLVNSSGTATGVGISFIGTVSSANDTPYDNSGSDALENGYFLICGNDCGSLSSTVCYMISGLPANTPAALYLYSPNFSHNDSGDPVDQPNRSSALTANGTAISLPSGSGTNNVLAYVTTDSNGQIFGTWGVPAGNESDWSGFQIAYPVSAPPAPVVQAPDLGRIAPTATHDFNGDCKSDILWRNTSGVLAMWLMDGGQVFSSANVASVPSVWSVAASRDFNGDGNTDILWLDSSGDLAVWLMNGAALSSGLSLGNVGTAWSVTGTGDFNGNGTADILWRNTTTGDAAIWLMSNGQFSSAVDLGVVPLTWHVVGTGDFNGDGITDILWRNVSTGDVSVWLMNNSGKLASGLDLGVVPLTWTVIGTGDFNGDGTGDILWRDTSGDLAIWLISHGAFSSGATIATVPTTWSVAETGDFNGDGKSDILWTDTSGDLAVWLMNGLSVSAFDGLGNVGTSWQVQGQNAD